MQSRTTYSLAASLVLTFAACARQEEPEYLYEDDDSMSSGNTSSGGSSSKAGSTSSGKAGSSSTGTGGSTTLPPAGSVGGKGGSKGTGGSKATAGSSTGSAGDSGEAGSGSGGGEDPVNMPVDGVSVTFKAQEGSDADFLGGELFVTNDSSESFSLDNIKIRYYFTNELNSPPAFVWQWGQFGPSNNLGGITCTGMVVEMTETTADANFYVELSCPAGDFSSGSQLRTSWKAGNQGSGKLTQDGDWSYVADGEAPKVVVLDGNTIIWGIEPE